MLGQSNHASLNPTNARILTQGWRRIALIAFAMILIALPFLVKNFTVFQLTLCIVYAIAVLGLNLLTGFNGQISLGHSAFFAIGAYTAAILIDKSGVPYWATLPIAGAVCLIVGFLFGLPALRLEGHYLALATYAFGLAMPQLLKHKSVEHWTNSFQGITIAKPTPPFSLPAIDRIQLPFGIVFDFRLTPDRWVYFFTLMVAVIMFWLALNLLRGRIGRAMIAVRDNPIAARTMGVNSAMVKSITFGISSMYTGIAGALAAIAVQFVAPDSFSVLLSISLLVGVVLGGLGSVWGAVVGGIFIQFIPNIAEGVSKSAPWAVYGVILIGAMYAMPGGASSLFEKLGNRIRRSYSR